MYQAICVFVPVVAIPLSGQYMVAMVTEYLMVYWHAPSVSYIGIKQPYPECGYWQEIICSEIQ